MSGAAILEIATVSKKFDEAVAVDKVSFSVREGALCSLLGPSGCGKTTVLRMIAGFEMPDSGDIRIAGRSCTNDPPYRRDLAMVFQGYALFPHRTVMENVEFGLRMRGKGDRVERAQAARDTLGMVGLAGFEGRYPRQLSGGQQQRVALARALILKPKLLLLDEPLSALDLKMRKTMRYELKRLQDLTGITTIYVTHDQDEALSMSDQIVVMNAGTVEQIGPPKAIYEKPATGFVADFIGEPNLLSARVASIGMGSLTLDLEVSGNTIVVPITALTCEPGTLVRGDPVVLVVRAERAVLSDGSENSSSSIRGTIAQRAYLGGINRYFVKAAQSELVLVADSTQELALGSRTNFGWQPDQIVVVRGG